MTLTLRRVGLRTETGMTVLEHMFAMFPSHQLPSGNLSSCIHSIPSDLNNGTAENLSLLQRNASLLDLFQGISVGHQLS